MMKRLLLIAAILLGVAGAAAFFYRDAALHSGILWGLERAGCEDAVVDDVISSATSISVRFGSTTCTAGTLVAAITFKELLVKRRGEDWKSFDLTVNDIAVSIAPTGERSTDPAPLGDLLFNIPAFPDIKISAPHVALNLTRSEKAPIHLDGSISADLGSLTASVKQLTGSGPGFSVRNAEISTAGTRSGEAISIWNLAFTASEIVSTQPIENIFAKAALARNNGASVKVTFSLLKFNTAGASIMAPGAALNVPSGALDARIKVTGLDIERVMSLYPQGEVTADGIIDGELSLRTDAKKFQIEGAHFAARPPGGAIKIPLPAGGNTELTTAQKALQDLRYQQLTAEGSSNAEGTLALKIAVTGTSPVIGGNRPVTLNLNVEENLPALLRSVGIFGEIERFGR